MFVVDIDPEHGVIAAPADLECLTQPTVDLLHRRGFRWDDREEMFTAPVANGTQEDATELAVCVVVALVMCGHRVLVAPAVI